MPKTVKPGNNDTLLHIAIRLKRQDLLEWLGHQNTSTHPKRKVDVTRSNDDGYTALDLALVLGEQRVEMYEQYFTPGMLVLVAR